MIHEAPAEALIEGGADVNKPSGEIHRNEPIGWALLPGAENAVRLLLERGAKVRNEHRERLRRSAVTKP